MRKTGIILGAGLAVAAVETGIASYFFKRTILRGNAKNERTIQMAGTDWNCYLPSIRKDKEWLNEQEKEEIEITSGDGLKLHGTFFKGDDLGKVILCFHGYTSCGMSDFISLSRFYMNHGYSTLLVDERAHGESEGKYIGFGCLDRYDARRWIGYLEDRFQKHCEIILHGISMGGATVLMTSGLNLPPSVKGIISDCAFTSAFEVFESVLKKTYHIPAFPILQIADKMAKSQAGYGLNECNAREEVKQAKIPILFIHGDADTFVPSWMCSEIYKNCASRKDILIIKGASHAECYYKDTKGYEGKVRSFLKSLEVEL